MSEAKDYKNARDIFNQMIGRKIVDIQELYGSQLFITMDDEKEYKLEAHPAFGCTIKEVNTPK